MRIFRDLPEIDKNKKTVITIGTFDGVHKGHSDLLDTVIDISKNGELESFLITFEPHPRTVVASDFKIKILTTLDEKASVLEKVGIQNLAVINFTEEFSNMNADEFIENMLINKLNPGHIVIGYDHKFGKDRKGDGAYLKKCGEKYGFEVTTVPAVKIDGDTISSTKIRNALYEGDVSKASYYLDRNYTLSGKVVTGAQRGRNLGFPTANINPVDENKLIPADGVYAIKAEISGKIYNGVLNIGRRPTFENFSEPVIETYLFELNSSVYDEEIKLEFVDKIREERKFNSEEELIEQINLDIKRAKEILN